MQYTNVNGYLLPNLISTDTVRPIGRYGEMRRQFLENHRPDMLDRLLLEDRLNRHLSQVDEEAGRQYRNVWPGWPASSRWTKPSSAQIPWSGCAG